MKKDELDALIADADRLAKILSLKNMSNWDVKASMFATALRAYRATLDAPAVPEQLAAKDEEIAALIARAEAAERERDTLSESLAMHQRKACEHCGSKRLIQSHPGCPMCGAPNCCLTCCQVATLESECDALRAELASVKAAPVRLDERDMAVLVAATVQSSHKALGAVSKIALGNALESIAAVRAAQEAGNATH